MGVNLFHAITWLSVWRVCFIRMCGSVAYVEPAYCTLSQNFGKTIFDLAT